MSYRGRGYASHQQRRAVPNGGRHRGRSFPADSNSDLDDNDHVRLPEIDRDVRERRPQKTDGKINSRIPLPARNNEGVRNPPAGEPRRPRNFNSANPELSNDSNSDPAGKDQRRSRVNAAKRVTFYRNGDKHFKGVEMVVTRQRYRSFETIVEDLSKAIPLPYGVRNVFSPGGSAITTIGQLEHGRHYICSSGDQLIKNVNYGQKQREKPRSLDVESLSDGSSLSSSSRDSKFGASNSDGNPKPRVVTVLSEHDRNKKCKILLNRKTVKSFEDVLRDISDMLKYTVKELRTLEGGKVCNLNKKIQHFLQNFESRKSALYENEYFVYNFSGLGKIIRCKLTLLMLNKLNPLMSSLLNFRTKFTMNVQEVEVFVELKSYYTLPLAKWNFAD